MKKLLIALLVLVPMASLAQDHESLIDQFTQLEKVFARAYQEKDFTLLEQLLAPEYALTVSARPDSPYPRAFWLSLLADYNVRHFEISGVQVRCLQATSAGDCELAVVSSINKQEADVGGQDRSGEFFIVDIWARRSGNWMVTARYSGRTEAAVPKLMEEKR